jgi:hypothetical protein
LETEIEDDDDWSWWPLFWHVIWTKGLTFWLSWEVRWWGALPGWSVDKHPIMCSK